MVVNTLGDGFFYADRWIDRHDKANSNLLQFFDHA